MSAGKSTGYASTVNVRDKVAGFVVSLAGMSDHWDKDASPALLRCRNGLGRSSDPKVVALRQAVLEKCMAFKGPPPTQGARHYNICIALTLVSLFRLGCHPFIPVLAMLHCAIHWQSVLSVLQ